jgi:drug/metabolite transporter (DMT)-like permease
MAVWAGNFIVVKAAIGILPPIGYTFLRFALGGVFLLAFTRYREGSVGIPFRDLVPIAALGALGFGVYQMLWTTALQHTTAGTSSLIIAATPIFTMLIAAAIGSDTLSRWKVLGATVSFCGVGAVIAAGTGLAIDNRLIGELMTLFAALLWAAYMALGAPFLRRHSPLRTTAWAIAAGTVVLIPFGTWQLVGTDLSAIGPGAILAVIYSGVLAAAISNVIVFRGVKRLGPTRIANLQFLVPALAVLLAAVFLGEPIQLIQVLGGATIVLGILIARRDAAPVFEAELVEPA